MRPSSRGRCTAALPLLLLSALSCLCLPLLCVADEYIIFDLRSVVSHGAPELSLPARLVTVAAADFGNEPGFPAAPDTRPVSLLALPQSNADGCANTPLPTVSASIVLMARRGNCTFATKAALAQKAGAKGLIVVNWETEAGAFAMSAGGANANATLSPATTAVHVRIPVVMASFQAGDPLIRASLAGSSLQRDPDDDGSHSPKVARDGQNYLLQPVFAHRYVRPVWDPSFLCMLMLATATVMYAAYLSAAAERRARAARSGAPAAARVSVVSEEELPHEYLTLHQALFFIIGASCALLVLFFFIRYLIWILILLFCFAGLQALTHLGSQFLRWAYPTYTRTLHLPWGLGETSVYKFVSFLCSLALVLAWVVNRNEPGAWVVQDVMGVGLLLVIQQSLRLPDIKVSTILLSLAFAYDVFWVFISPWFFAQSVMVAVAQGGGTGEAVPMLLRLPRLAPDELAPGGYSMLGLGDIALPGLLVSYLLRFDLSRNSAAASSKLFWLHSYFALASLGYAAGLACTYLALVAMGQGQPALLYLVPTTLGLTAGVAWRRGELREMWEGSGGGHVATTHVAAAAGSINGSSDGAPDASTALAGSSAGLGSSPSSSRTKTKTKGSYAAIGGLHSAPAEHGLEEELNLDDLDGSLDQEDENVVLEMPSEAEIEEARSQMQNL